MEETETVVWHEPYRADTGRYFFPLPKSVASSIERSMRPVWHRYLDRSFQQRDAVMLDALEGWWIVFETMLPILKDLHMTSDAAEGVEEKVHGLHAALQAMSNDLIDLIDFGAATLPYDPRIIREIERAIREHPELFTFVRPGESAEEEIDSDQQLSECAAAEGNDVAAGEDDEEVEGAPDAALPVPPGDDGPTMP